MLELTNTALLAISTPLDEFNYYSKVKRDRATVPFVLCSRLYLSKQLVEQKDENGDPFFKTIKAGRACDDCMRLSYDLMIKCDHIEG